MCVTMSQITVIYIGLSIVDQWISFKKAKGAFQKHLWALKNLRALQFSPVNEIQIFLCMGKIFCVEFQRVPFYYIFMKRWNVKSSLS